MRVLVYEHVCGGGMCGRERPGGLVAQGMGMWRALVEDFLAAGVEVVTTVDVGVGPVEGLGGAEVVEVRGAAEFDGVIERLARGADAAVVIAPEIDGVLEGWAVRLERWGVRSLGCGAGAVGLCADKLGLAERLAERGVATPRAWAVEAGEVVSAGEAGAVVVKPRYGVGCESVFVVRAGGLGGAGGALTVGDGLEAGGKWVAQDYVEGVAASVGVLVDGDRVTVLAAGEQVIEGDRELRYAGGRLPLGGGLARRAEVLARAAVGAVEGLGGYVGVDVVLGACGGGEDDYVIEINPRLTVSYVGLRRLCVGNIAGAMLDPGVRLGWRECGPGAVAYDAAGRVVEGVRH